MSRRVGWLMLSGLLALVPSIAFSTTGSVDEMPDPINRPKPDCGDVSERVHLQATVQVRALVDTTGHVRQVRVVKSVPAFDSAAVECARRWTFKPARSDHRPVAVWVGIPIRFDCGGRTQSGIAVETSRSGDAVSPPDRTSRAGPRLFAGEYRINGNRFDVVRVTRVDRDRVELESPGQWVGSGVVHDDIYWGVFLYREDAPEAKNRGARGTHFGTILPSGEVNIVGTFSNRRWPPFRVTWSPGARRSGAEQDSLTGGWDLRRVPVIE